MLLNLFVDMLIASNASLLFCLLKETVRCIGQILIFHTGKIKLFKLGFCRPNAVPLFYFYLFGGHFFIYCFNQDSLNIYLKQLHVLQFIKK